MFAPAHLGVFSVLLLEGFAIDQSLVDAPILGGGGSRGRLLFVFVVERQRLRRGHDFIRLSDAAPAADACAKVTACAGANTSADADADADADASTRATTARLPRQLPAVAAVGRGGPDVREGLVVQVLIARVSYYAQHLDSCEPNTDRPTSIPS